MLRRSALAAATAGLLLASARGEAHKPITSPFTFNDDVLPIVQAKCGACHVSGGVAPMSLLTHADAVPWGASMRAELMAGHMPPWPIDGPAARFRNVSTLTARELNVLLTWASGGTPEGGAQTIAPAPGARGWPLGTPDAVLTMPAAFTIAADVQERVAEFTIPTGLGGERWLRAVDLLPGTPAVVRSATVSVKSSGQLLALWVPGDHPVPLEGGTAFRLPDGAELLLRVRYRKTWEHERASLTDRSNIGLYFAGSTGTEVRALPLTIGTTTIAEPLRALAISPADDVAHARVSVLAVRPDGSREEMIAFRPRPGWARRYWFAQPIALPRGTRIDVRATFGEDGLLPPGTLHAPAPAVASKVRLTLDAVPIRP
jgi:hypothetical protein